MIINEDCLLAMSKMNSASIDMAYLDPPFYTQKIQKLRARDGIEYAFNDKWSSLSDYLSFLRPRLHEVKRLLNDTGSVFLHCDNSASHHLRVLLDEVFGEANFRSEIIWTYRRWSNTNNGLMNAHQTIFCYSKSRNCKFKTLMTEYSHTTNIDQILQDRVRNSNNKTVYKKDQSGNVVCSKEKKGVPLSDVWDIPLLNPKARERVGYPTQKPLLLLDRIITISTDPNDIVLDPFCGSGTTLVSAMLLGRRYIGIDVNGDATELSANRLTNPIKTQSQLLKRGIESYDNKPGFVKQILSGFECNVVQRNRGIDAFLVQLYMGKHVPVRIQKENEPILAALNSLLHATRNKGFQLMILIRTKNSEDTMSIDIPNNVIVIDSYQSSIDKALQSFDVQSKNNVFRIS